MPLKNDPFLNTNYGWETGESGWGSPMNENLLRFSILLNKRFNSTESTLPLSPVSGDAHFLTTDNLLYYYVENSWYYTELPIGFELTRKSDEQTFKFNGTTLVEVTYLDEDNVIPIIDDVVDAALVDRTQTIENVAALSTYTPVVGQVYMLKEYMPGTGVGGGYLKAYAGAASHNGVSIFAGPAGYHFGRIDTGILFVEAAGGRAEAGFDNTPAIQRVMSALPWSGSAANSGGALHFGPGNYEFSPFTVNRPITFKGAGKYSTTLLKNAPGVGITFELDTSAGGGMEDIAVAKKAGVSDTSGHHGAIFQSGRFFVKNILLSGHGGIGGVIVENNASIFMGVETVLNDSHGFAVIAPASPNNNANAMLIANLDARVNGGSGLYLENCFANTIIAPTCQANGRYAIELGPFNQLHNIIGVYSEANALGAGILSASSNANKIQYNIVEDADPTDLGTNNSVILQDDDTFGYQQINPIKTPSVQIGNPATQAPGFLKIYDTGTQYSIALQGTGGDLTLEFLSEGAGILTAKFQKLYEDSLALTLQNSWVNGAGLGAPTIYKDSTGRVFLSGGIQGGATTSGTVVSTIPSQYRPGVARRVISANSAGIVIFNITAGGNIVFDAGTNALITLDGLNWHL